MVAPVAESRGSVKCSPVGAVLRSLIAGAARVEAILLGMAAGGYIHRREQEELLRGAAAAGLSAEGQANLAAGSDSLAVQQQAQDSSADAVVAGAAGAAAFLAHSTRAALRDAARRDGAS